MIKYFTSSFQASLGLSREYLINGVDDHDVNSYYNYMVRSVKILICENEDNKNIFS